MLALLMQKWKPGPETKSAVFQQDGGKPLRLLGLGHGL